MDKKAKTTLRQLCSFKKSMTWPGPTGEMTPLLTLMGPIPSKVSLTIGYFQQWRCSIGQEIISHGLTWNQGFRDNLQLRQMRRTLQLGDETQLVNRWTIGQNH
jgi:hypothetical protein